MDSITQIVLGAAVGEAVLGKKVGNKAMFWGAVGGTIPDLDIVADTFLNKAEALAVHRGFSHSIVFACLGGLLFGWLIWQLYKSPHYKWIAMGMRVLFGAALMSMLLLSRMHNPVILYGCLGLISIYLIYTWYNRSDLEKNDFSETVYFRDWASLMFWVLLTHPILDCFTMYGTQLFSPFSDYRVAFSTISVADPLYTVPFIICLVVAAFHGKDKPARRKWNTAGLIISSSYLLFTVINKQNINQHFENQLAKQNITYTRYLTGPSILNNILWSCTAESDSVFYQGQYSLFDTSDVKFVAIPKNHNFLNAKREDRTINILKWFTKEYYNVIHRKDGRLQFNDLRFGTFKGYGNGENDFIFRFIINKKEDGFYKMVASEGGPPEGSEDEMMGYLFDRIKGR